MDTSSTSPDTRNPQDPASLPGASNASDFQSTASDEVLRQENNKEDLDVERTGQPIEGSAQAVAKSDNTAYFWALGIILVIIVGVVLVLRLMNKEDAGRSVSAVKPAAKKPVAASSKKSAARSTAKKKPAAKKTRKSSKRRK